MKTCGNLASSNLETRSLAGGTGTSGQEDTRVEFKRGKQMEQAKPMDWMKKRRGRSLEKVETDGTSQNNRLDEKEKGEKFGRGREKKDHWDHMQM